MPKFAFKVEYKYIDIFEIEAPTKEAAELYLNEELSDGHLTPEDDGDFESTVELIHEER